MRRFNWTYATILALGVVAGCGDSKPAGSGGEPGKDSLEDLGRLLKVLADEGKKPPAKLAELEAVEPMIPLAGVAIRNDDIVYLWGAGYTAGGDKIVAHEKKTPTDGGYVLRQDGTVKTMTADEFRSAPKAK